MNATQARSHGAARAHDDFLRLRARAYFATDDELQSRWWRFKHSAFAFWLGFTAPPLWTRAGRAYRREIKSLYTDYKMKVGA